MAARLLLVHSPLVGCATWDLVAADLAGGGYELGVPDLTGTVMAGPPVWGGRVRGVGGAGGGRRRWRHGGGGGALAGLVRDPAARQPSAGGCPGRRRAMLGKTPPPAPQWPDAPAAYLQLSEAYED